MAASSRSSTLLHNLSRTDLHTATRGDTTHSPGMVTIATKDDASSCVAVGRFPGAAPGARLGAFDMLDDSLSDSKGCSIADDDDGGSRAMSSPESISPRLEALLAMCLCVGPPVLDAIIDPSRPSDSLIRDLRSSESWWSDVCPLAVKYLTESLWPLLSEKNELSDDADVECADLLTRSGSKSDELVWPSIVDRWKRQTFTDKTSDTEKVNSSAPDNHESRNTSAVTKFESFALTNRELKCLDSMCEKNISEIVRRVDALCENERSLQDDEQFRRSLVREETQRITEWLNVFGPDHSTWAGPDFRFCSTIKHPECEFKCTGSTALSELWSIACSRANVPVTSDPTPMSSSSSRDQTLYDFCINTAPSTESCLRVVGHCVSRFWSMKASSGVHGPGPSLTLDKARDLCRQSGSKNTFSPITGVIDQEMILTSARRRTSSRSSTGGPSQRSRAKDALIRHIDSSVRMCANLMLGKYACSFARQAIWCARRLGVEVNAFIDPVMRYMDAVQAKADDTRERIPPDSIALSVDEEELRSQWNVEGEGLRRLIHSLGSTLEGGSRSDDHQGLSVLVSGIKDRASVLANDRGLALDRARNELIKAIDECGSQKGRAIAWAGTKKVDRLYIGHTIQLITSDYSPDDPVVPDVETMKVCIKKAKETLSVALTDFRRRMIDWVASDVLTSAFDDIQTLATGRAVDMLTDGVTLGNIYEQSRDRFITKTVRQVVRERSALTSQFASSACTGVYTEIERVKTTARIACDRLSGRMKDLAEFHTKLLDTHLKRSNITMYRAVHQPTARFGNKMTRAGYHLVRQSTARLSSVFGRRAISTPTGVSTSIFGESRVRHGIEDQSTAVDVAVIAIDAFGGTDATRYIEQDSGVQGLSFVGIDDRSSVGILVDLVDRVFERQMEGIV